ncbi:MAG TPA: hypothetical protein VEF90_17670 [Xanthobacteraceae bacterium]|nr:hypothetical protein [Xanthobacteraceae bacterium]
MTEAPAKKLTLPELAEFVDSRLVRGCTMLDGKLAGMTLLVLDKGEAEALTQLAATLGYLAPHADRIKRAIAGARG